MPRRKRPETLLREAVLADDNLAVIKAHRLIIVDDLISCDEPADRVKLSASLTQVNREIIKLEGAREIRDERIEAAYDEYDSVVKAGLSING